MMEGIYGREVCLSSRGLESIMVEKHDNKLCGSRSQAWQQEQEAKEEDRE